MKLLTKFTALLLIAFAIASCSQPPKVTLYLVGDSTMAPKKEKKRPETGWGEKIINYLDTTLVAVENHARNGKSTRTFIEEGRWDAVMEKLQTSDIVFVEFGHNDEVQTKRSSTKPDEFQNNLRRYINDTRSKGALPVLLTSVTRRSFDENQVYYDSHAEYNELMREVATELDVILVDLNVSSTNMVKSDGYEASSKYYLHGDSAELANYPKGVKDNTHFNDFGANTMAKLAVDEIVERDIKELTRILKK